MEKRVEIREVDKDVYEIYTGDINLMYLSGEQLRNLRKDIKSFFEEEAKYDEPSRLDDW